MSALILLFKLKGLNNKNKKDDIKFRFRRGHHDE